MNPSFDFTEHRLMVLSVDELVIEAVESHKNGETTMAEVRRHIYTLL